MDCPNPGAEVEFLRYCLQTINATAVLIPQYLRSDEMIDMLANGTADITLIPLLQKRERMEKVDFSTPIGLVYVGYYVMEAERIDVPDRIRNVFSVPALSILILTSLAVATLLYIYSKLFYNNRMSLLESITVTFSGLLRQCHLNLNGPICVSILACSWLWFTFVITAHYEAKIRSLLMLARHRGSLFTNLDQAMDTMEYYGWKMVIEKRSYSPFEHCYPIQCERLRRLQKRSLIKEHDGSDLLSVVSKDHFAFSALPKDMAPHPRSIIDDRRHVLFVRDDYIMPIYLAYALRK
ncbi:hypothetical protein RB195_020392 [Necator americanus]|uniref:Solute-binding protein family 3/N-terminal domain-containing protein n=1 Tax=Necator americanus TaxID=51031 RepID=A0ABR1CLE4_NECAM